MSLVTQGSLLRIIIGEDQQYDGKPLYRWIVEKARKNKLAGATVWRGLEGYGASKVIHTGGVMRLFVETPVVIEIIDEEERVGDFLSYMHSILDKGVATLETVEMHFFGKPS